jgi:hypothetical protein
MAVYAKRPSARGNPEVYELSRQQYADDERERRYRADVVGMRIALPWCE